SSAVYKSPPLDARVTLSTLHADTDVTLEALRTLHAGVTLDTLGANVTLRALNTLEALRTLVTGRSLDTPG
ncbi:hypothetical protein, partial [Streptomyces sp. NPDC059468]|uniref:hypothetical protein n=1 Tax=Streptomyces sp. NPDC059468 TaxID=3346845 RepID=UPI0036AE36E8